VTRFDQRLWGRLRSGVAVAAVAALAVTLAIDPGSIAPDAWGAGTAPQESRETNFNEVVAGLDEQTPQEAVDLVAEWGDAETPTAEHAAVRRIIGPAGGLALMGTSGGLSSASGNWTATSLSLSSTWGAAGATGGYTWSMPIPVPAAPAGPSPQLSISYSSGSSDGRLPTTNNQSGLLGEGFELPTSYVERSYLPCAADETSGANNVGHPSADLCWGPENATLVFNGSAVELVKDAASGVWHAKQDDGSRIELLTDGFNSGKAKDYWKVTTADGTQYIFGRGQRSASDTTALGSAWTVPVYGNNPGEPCYHAPASGGFASSRCTQVWRWNLEYVIDISGNTMTYFYSTETNRYVYDPLSNTAGTSVSYVAGGRLTSIQYGTRLGQETTGSAPAKVTFSTGPRCITDLNDPASFCSGSQTATSENYWPDTPTDLVCGATSGCPSISPVFFERYRLTSINTFGYDGAAYQPVSTWTLKQRFVAQGDGIGVVDATGVMLVTDSITRTGKGGTTSTSDDVKLPANQFSYTFFPNRVDSVSDGQPPMERPRITNVRTESGASVSVNYRTECTAEDMPGTDEVSQAANTRLCFPVKWYPSGGSPLVEYFHKYVVESIVESAAPPGTDGDELVTGSLPTVTTYTYSGGAAWAKPTGAMVKPSEVTYADFRGFGDVTTTVGVGAESSSSLTRYFRGTGATLSAGPTSDPVTATDLDRYRGQVFATVDLNGATIVGQTVTVPGAPFIVATNAAGVTSTRIPSSTTTGFRYDAAGDVVARTESVTTFDEHSQPISIDDHGDLADPDDDVCSTIEYASSTGFAAAHLVALVAHTQTVGVACGVSPSVPADLISSATTSYDSVGRPLVSESLDPTDGVGEVQVKEVLAYDVWGRPLQVADAAGEVTSIAYEQSSGGLLASVTTTTPDPDGPGPLGGFTTTSRFDPITGNVIATVDQNGLTTTGVYDALGRLKSVTYPEHAGFAVPSVQYTYTVSTTGLNAVLTKTLGADGTTQHLSSVLYDGMLRPFQYQVEGLDAGVSHADSAKTRGRMVTQVTYDSSGRTATQTGQWWATGVPASTAIVAPSVPPSQTTFEYDGAGRTIAQVFWVGTTSNPANERWRTITGYDGLTTMQVPPMGGTPQAMTVDARGRTVELREYLRDPDIDTAATTIAAVKALPSQATTYSYDLAGDLTTMHDPAGNAWTYVYDWGGRQIGSSDPDGGTTTTTYDLLGQVVARTDGNGDTLATTYDALGRPTTLRDGSTTGTIRVQWGYDQATDANGDPVLGVQSSSTRYDDGQAYTTTVDAVDAAYRPTSVTETLPDTAEFAALASRSFTTRYAYTADGQPAQTTQPAVATSAGTKVLGQEIVTTHYDTASMPSWMSGGFGWGTYVAESRFRPDGLPTAFDLGNTYGAVVSYSFEDGTNRLQGVSLKRQNFDTDLALAYGYDPAGNVVSVKDQAKSTPSLQDNQCFGYDGLRRLQVAWTAASGDCSTAPSSGSVGGAAAYWSEYSYDVLGNRTGIIEHQSSTTTSTAYTVGSGGAGPHQVTDIVSTSGGTTTSTSYSYDAAGNRASSTSGGTTTAYDWDAEGHLTSAGDAEYVYDASGARIVRRDAGGVTVYLPAGQELTISPSGTVTAARYYAFAGTTVAVRTGAGLGGVSSLVCDGQGSVVASVPNTTWTASSVQRSYQDPFGGMRGTAASVPGDRGFLGAVKDGSGLSLLGARYFDAGLGRFLSVDPVLDPGNPAQFNAYVYAGNNPLTWSDPSGLDWFGDMWNSAAKWVDDNQAAIVGAVVGIAVTAGCTALTGGVGVVGCAVLGGMAGGAASNLWDSQVTHKTEFSWGSLAFDMGVGGLLGGLIPGAGAVLGKVAGAVMKTAVGTAVKTAVTTAVNAVKSAVSSVVNTVKNAVTNVVKETVQGVKNLIGGSSSGAARSGGSSLLKQTAAGVCSFAGATPVLMADGSQKPIDQVQVGDQVVASDPETGEQAAEPVEQVFVHQDTLIELRLDGDVLTTTVNHPFWSVTDGEFERADQLSAGELVLAAGGSLVRVEGLQHATAHVGTAYNLAIRDIHTYHVGSAEILVHNTCALPGAAASSSGDDWAQLSGMLRDASSGKGNFGLGSGTASQAQRAGLAWVGKGYSVASDGKTLLSSDGLRQWRPPAYKPNLDMWQSNFEWRSIPRGQWQGNGHLDIMDY